MFHKVSLLQNILKYDHIVVISDNFMILDIESHSNKNPRISVDTGHFCEHSNVMYCAQIHSQQNYFNVLLFDIYYSKQVGLY